MQSCNTPLSLIFVHSPTQTFSGRCPLKFKRLKNYCILDHVVATILMLMVLKYQVTELLKTQCRRLSTTSLISTLVCLFLYCLVIFIFSYQKQSIFHHSVVSILCCLYAIEQFNYLLRVLVPLILLNIMPFIFYFKLYYTDNVDLIIIPRQYITIFNFSSLPGEDGTGKFNQGPHTKFSPQQLVPILRMALNFSAFLIYQNI